MKLINIFIIIIFFFQVAKADQKNPKLDELFEQLKISNNQNKYDIIINEIWSIWLESDDNEINKDFNIALSLMNKFRYKQSILFFSRTIEKNPSFAEAWNKRATAYYLIGDYENSINDINQTLILEPRHFGAMNGLALILFNLEKYSEAITIYQEILKILPYSIETRNKIIRIKEIFLEKA